jgi:hypothetical protein
LDYKKYFPWEVGECRVGNRSDIASCEFILGRFSNKKSKETGFYISILLPSGDLVLSESRFALRECLFDISKLIKNQSYSLHAIGLSSRFRETDRTVNTGFGYYANHDELIHMMELRVG